MSFQADPSWFGTMKTALGLVIAILVIATVSNPGLAKPSVCCRLQLPCCHGRRLEREPSAAVQQRGIESLKDSPRPNVVNSQMTSCIRHIIIILLCSSYNTVR